MSNVSIKLTSSQDMIDAVISVAKTMNKERGYDFSFAKVAISGKASLTIQADDPVKFFTLGIACADTIAKGVKPISAK